MKCPECQHENPKDSRFCNKCGQALEVSASPSLQAPSIEDKINKIQRYLPEGLTEKILSERNKEDVGYLKAISDYVHIDDAKIDKEDISV